MKLLRLSLECSMQEFCRAKYKCKKESVTSYSSFTLKAIIRLIVVYEKMSYISVQI